jgi:hypothetical protein
MQRVTYTEWPGWTGATEKVKFEIACKVEINASALIAPSSTSMASSADASSSKGKQSASDAPMGYEMPW